MSVCACVRACVSECACVRACVRGCVMVAVVTVRWVGVHTFLALVLFQLEASGGGGSGLI